MLILYTLRFKSAVANKAPPLTVAAYVCLKRSPFEVHSILKAGHDAPALQ